MKQFKVEVTVKWTQTIEAKNYQEARSKTAQTFKQEYGFTPREEEMHIVSEKLVI